MANDRSLTAEILDRLEQTFPSIPERLATVEAKILDSHRGLDALAERVRLLERRVKELERDKG